MSKAVVCSATTQLAERMAIALTPGLGPTKARQLVEHFGSARFVNGTGEHRDPSCLCPIVSHWESAEFSAGRDRKRGASRRNHALDGRRFSSAVPERSLRSSTDHAHSRHPEVLTKPGIAMVGTRHPTPTVLAWPSGWHAIWPPKDWSLLVSSRANLRIGLSDFVRQPADQ